MDECVCRLNHFHISEKLLGVHIIIFRNIFSLFSYESPTFLMLFCNRNISFLLYHSSCIQTEN